MRSRPFTALIASLVAFIASLAVNTALLRAQLPPATISTASVPGAAAYNLRIVTDASPDLTDLQSLINSTTSQWPSAEQKVWALFFWSHILKRQTSPIVLHGFEVTDPIRNFNDFGFAMCSTISGINQTLYEALGLPHQYWDICNHTVSHVFYDNAFHMVDSSMSNLVTADDGRTLASLQDAAASGARLVKERSLYSTSPYGFLTGSDTMRNLDDITNPANGSVLNGYARAFCETSLKLRDYYYNWNNGHRYVLNVREHESLTRYYRRLGDGPDYYVPSEHEDNSDPANTFENDSANRFGIRGNGRWLFSPILIGSAWQLDAYSWSNMTASANGGLQPSAAGQPASVIYKVQAANAITSQHIRAEFNHPDSSASGVVAVSVNHGLTWQDVGSIGTTAGSAVPLAIDLRAPVTGVYETLVRITMTSGSSDAITLTGLSIETITQVNTKALPRLNIGRNEVYVGADDQSDTMVLWPDLRADLWKRDAYQASNIGSQSVSVGRKYTAVVYPAALNTDASLTYRMESPTDFTQVRYGGRLYNSSAGSYIDFLHSFDNGATWTPSYRLSDVSKPYDVVHYETVPVPPGVRVVQFKFVLHNTSTDTSHATGLYSVRMEGNYKRSVESTPPVAVTLRWAEVAADRSIVARSHKQLITQFPFKYIVNVGGHDHPIMDSMTVSLASETDATPYGYSDGVDVGGQKYLYATRTDGINVAAHMPYTISRAPSGFQSSAPGSNTTILTDGIVGAPVSGSFSYWFGQCWTSGGAVDVNVDLGSIQNVGAFRAHLFGYPSWDALKGQVPDTVEILTSTDGTTYASRGWMPTALWKKDVPINYMLQDNETASGWNFELALATQVAARFVKYHVTPKRDYLCVSELQVLDRVTYAPFDLRVTLPQTGANQAPTVSLTSPQQGQVFTTGTSIPLAAAAADSDGAVTRVDFLVNGSVVSSDTSSPYSAYWSASGAGTYTLSARATDDAGGSAVSPPVSVTVQDVNTGPGVDVVLWAAEAPVKFDWAPVADSSAAGGVRLQNPDRGAAKIATALASPTRYFEMTFNALGGVPYRLWIRGKALANDYANDSVHVQFDQSLDSTGAAAYRIGTTSSLVYSLEECSNCGVSGWGWQDTGWGSPGLPGPVVYFASSGLQRIRVQVREDGVGIDQIVLSSNRWLNVAPGPPKNDATILQETDPQGTSVGTNDVVLYAAEAPVAVNWSIVTDTTAAGGSRLQNPNLGAAKVVTALAAPSSYFEMTFNAWKDRGYRLWIRGKAISNYWSNDSVHVQFDASLDGINGLPVYRIGTTSSTVYSLEECSNCGVSGWGWEDNGWGAVNYLGPLIYFDHDGLQRIRIQVREDGLGIDQIVLSSVQWVTTRPGASKNDATILPKQ